jgi:eukaryotic-like serine/threonine-protein kinase
MLHIFAYTRESTVSTLAPRRSEEPMADRDLSGRRLGEFVLRERIGRGSYGDVYRCEQPELKRHAVVKVLWRTDRDLAQERFLREAQLASRLDHPYAAHVYASGTSTDADERLLWIAMELVQGITLAEWLKTRGPMALEQFVPFFERVAEVVQAAHERGIVHRDLKPSNVMVIESGGKLLPKLLDFGIAKNCRGSAAPEVHEPADEAGRSVEQRTRTDPAAGDDRITRSDAGLGSRPYMSPEQWIDSSAVGPATDIYSLGVVAYEVLTGHVPFDAENTGEYYRRHLNAEMPPLGDAFSVEVDRAIRRALAKEPAHRHGSALELASELRDALRAQPREQLRSSAQQWAARARSPGLLWRGDMLADLESWTRRVPSRELSELECSFVAASQRRGRRVRWLRRSLVLLAAACALAVVQVRAVVRARMAEQIALASEVEQGRQALLHGESSEAVRHLMRAYNSGDRSPGVTFMLARALQPRMSELGRLTSSSGRMWSAMFAPDGKRILTTDDKAARMWDAESSQLLFTMSHGDIVHYAVFSPDGSRIITAGGDGSVRIWSASTGTLMHVLRDRQSTAKQWRYYAVAMSSEFVAAIDLMGRVAHVWNADTEEQIAELANDASELGMLAFSADGRWLATSGGDEVRVFDTATWKHAVTIAGPRVRSLSFDPTNHRLAVGTYDGIASLWEIPSAVRVRPLRAGGASVDAIAFSRDGALVATASRDGTEQIWDAKTGALFTQVNSHRNKIYAVEFSAQGDRLLSSGAGGAVVVSNVATGTPVVRLEGPRGLVFAARFDHESQRIVGASWDGTARVWDTSSPYRRWATPPIGPECDTMDSLVPDQRFVAPSCVGGTRVWDTARDELVAELPRVTAAGDGFYSAFPALSAAGDRAAIARANTVEVYALPSGQLLRTITHAAPVNAVAFAPVGHDLVSGALDGSLTITRDDHEPIALPSSQAGIDVVAILADGRVLSADANARLQIIDPRRNVVLSSTPAPYRVRLLRPSPDGKRLVTISTRDKQAPPSLWELDSLRRVADLEGHVGRVFAARFVARGDLILTAGSDGTARTWNATTGSPGRSFADDSRFLADADLAPDGSVVVAGASDGSLRFWDASNGRLLWRLEAHKSYIIGVHFEGSEIITRSFAGDLARWRLPQPDAIIEACGSTMCAAAPLPGA